MRTGPRKYRWIISRPDWQSRRQRAVLGGLTFVFWLAWFYLWLPAISFVAWLFGIHLFYVEIFQLEGYKAVLSLLGMYGLVVLAMGGSLVAWALYNWIRFRGIERRRARVSVTVDQLATDMKLSLQDLDAWQRCACMTAHHDERGRLITVRCDCNRRTAGLHGFNG